MTTDSECIAIVGELVITHGSKIQTVETKGLNLGPFKLNWPVEIYWIGKYPKQRDASNILVSCSILYTCIPFKE
jgi:hypothetical protein